MPRDPIYILHRQGGSKETLHRSLQRLRTNLVQLYIEEHSEKAVCEEAALGAVCAEAFGGSRFPLGCSFLIVCGSLQSST